MIRIEAPPHSAARQRARCSSAALAVEYAAAFGPATTEFLEATKMIEPPAPYCSIVRNASLATRKYPVESTL